MPALGFSHTLISPQLSWRHHRPTWPLSAAILHWERQGRYLNNIYVQRCNQMEWAGDRPFYPDLGPKIHQHQSRYLVDLKGFSAFVLYCPQPLAKLLAHACFRFFVHFYVTSCIVTSSSLHLAVQHYYFGSRIPPLILAVVRGLSQPVNYKSELTRWTPVASIFDGKCKPRTFLSFVLFAKINM